MISLKYTHRPIYGGIPRLGQALPAVPAVPSTDGVPKPAAIVTGLALTGLSAATAYVGISYGMNKRNTNVQRALGWTVGVIGVMSGLVRLIGTTALAVMPSSEKLV